MKYNNKQRAKIYRMAAELLDSGECESIAAALRLFKVEVDSMPELYLFEFTTVTWLPHLYDRSLKIFTLLLCSAIALNPRFHNPEIMKEIFQNKTKKIKYE